MMYSLYRAWFGAEESYPRLDRLSPPDIVVRVGNQGEHQFVAHKEILAMHSGYMKALLATTSPAVPTSSGNMAIDSSITSITVSSVGGEDFAPLLNYMYTGRLEVTSENIYRILLATHLLHMPGALEECRRALLRLRGPPTLPLSPPATQSGSILRPVPNRLVAPPFCWPQPSLYPPGSIGLSHLNHLQIPPTLPVLSPSMLHETAGTVSYSVRHPSSPTSFPLQRPLRSRTPSPTHRGPHSSVDDPDQETAKSTNRCSNAAAKTTSPCLSDSSERVSVTDIDQPGRSRARSRSSTDRRADTRGATDVIFDIACCDGPIKFHRVLNENYAAPSGVVAPKRPRACLDDDTSSENDENGRPEHDVESEGRPHNGHYTCKYCRHSFKSQYCYKKHARRHLFASDVETAAQQRPEVKKKEDKFADLNVQYYPCKICGSKFPSYYFVHKHKKLCHSNADDSASGGSVAEEVGPVQQSASESVDSK